MVQFLSINFFFLDFFNFCWVFQKFPFFCVTLYITYKAFFFFLMPADGSPYIYHSEEFSSPIPFSSINSSLELQTFSNYKFNVWFVAKS